MTDPAPNSGLGGVTALSPTDAWAVGGDAVLHWNGTNWTQVTIPGGYSTGLNSVSAGSPTDVWAVGTATTTNQTRQETLALHWNGSSWTRVATPTPVGDKFDLGLTGVTAISPTSAWAVGYYTSRDGAAMTLILQWNGTSWARVPSPDPGGKNGTVLNGVAATGAASAWAVGDYQHPSTASSTLILRWNGTSWTRS